jgi:hypothetical protein
MAERDFHAWVEVYFEEIGWLPFDPTGGAHGLDGGTGGDPTPVVTTPIVTTTTVPDRTTPPPSTPSDRTTPPPVETTAPVTTEVPVDEPDTFNFGLLLVIVIPILIAGAFALWVWSVFKRLKSAENRKFARYESAVSDSVAMEMYRYMFRLLRIEGVRVSRGEAPLEFSERADRLIPVTDDGALEAVMPVFEKLEFADISENSELLTADEYKALYEYVYGLYGKAVLEKKGFERIFRRFKFGKN